MHVPGFDIATRYVPAEERGVGGDWYDAFLLPSGALWIMTGDVVGHGLPAAAIMGRLRSSLRSYALESDDPAEVIARAWDSALAPASAPGLRTRVSR